MNKQKYILLYFLFLLPLVMQAQVLHPIAWQTNISKQEVQVGETLELIFTADIEKDWYLYSSDFSKDLGPMVTTFEFKTNDTYELVGEITPINPKEKDSELWGGVYTYFKGKAEFRQKIKILKVKPNIWVAVDYQVCTDVDGKCIPLDEEFTFTTIQVKKKGETNQNEEKNEENKSESDQSQSVLTFMFLSFLGGLAALLTPCVFPIIPMTVSFFTSKAENRSQAIRQGLLYGASIVGIYTLIGVLVSYLFGAEAANVLATHWLPNLLFFAIFIIFAISFFGAFEIVLPSSWVNSMDKKADKGGLLGIFFMALTLVVISFSCTGPIAGSILIASANGDFLMPMLGMFSFSMAFAIPFSLFAIFPAWLSSLPKSGGWRHVWLLAYHQCGV